MIAVATRAAAAVPVADAAAAAMDNEHTWLIRIRCTRMVYFSVVDSRHSFILIPFDCINIPINDEINNSI